MADEQNLNKQALAQYLQAPVADAARLALPHQIVQLYNSGNQTHVVFDRYHQPVTLQGGERKQADMIVEEIENFRDMRKLPRKLIPRFSPRGMTMEPAPMHPVIFEDIPPAAPSGPEPPAPATLVDDTAMLEKMNNLAAANERDQSGSLGGGV
jgi:hypothetical protein